MTFTPVVDGNALSAATINPWLTAIDDNTANILAIIAALTDPQIATATDDVTLTTSYQDVTGATLTFTTTNDNVPCLVTGVFFFNVTTVSSGVGDLMTGALAVDGTVQQVSSVDKQAIFHADTSALGGATVQQQWTPTLATAGSHTLKLQAKRSGTNGSFAARATATSISVVAFDF